jgi:hypothetical protein
MGSVILNKKFFWGATIAFAMSNVSHLIAVLALRNKISIVESPSSLALVALAIFLFSASLGYDGGKYKKWMILLPIWFGVLYAIQIAGMFVQFSHGFRSVWIDVNWHGTVWPLFLPLILTKKRARDPADGKNVEQAAPEDAQAPN